MNQLTLTQTQQILLTSITRRATSLQRTASRARLVLSVADTQNQRASGAANNVGRDTVGRWANRWRSSHDQLNELEANYQTGRLLLGDYRTRIVRDILSDAPRSGAPPIITEAQKQQILALAAEEPTKVGVPVTHWSHDLLARTAVDKGIIATISSTHIGRFLKAGHAQTASQ